MRPSPPKQSIVRIKPLSANRMWKGRRYKSAFYKAFEEELWYKLPQLILPPPPFKINLTICFSNLLADLDNPVKPILDIMQKKYNFNDKDVVELYLKRSYVLKGQEGIVFSITPGIPAPNPHAPGSGE